MDPSTVVNHDGNNDYVDGLVESQVPDGKSTNSPEDVVNESEHHLPHENDGDRNAVPPWHGTGQTKGQRDSNKRDRENDPRSEVRHMKTAALSEATLRFGRRRQHTQPTNLVALTP